MTGKATFTASRGAKPGTVLVLATTLVVLFNALYGFGNGIREAEGVAYTLGAVAAPILLPVVMALLFSVVPRFRNARSQTYVVFWTSILILLGTLSNRLQEFVSTIN